MSYNTWGGKNNSWGNRERKNKREEPNKLFGIFVAGVFLFAIGGTGLNWINDVIDKSGEAKEIIETVEKVSNSSNKEAERTNVDNSKVINNNTDFINETEIDISATDVRDILSAAKRNIQSKKVETIKVFNFDDINTLDTYNDNVISMLNDTDGAVIVAVIKSEGTSDDWKNMGNTLQELVELSSENIDAKKHSQVSLSGKKGTPMNYMTILVIYEES